MSYTRFSIESYKCDPSYSYNFTVIERLSSLRGNGHGPVGTTELVLIEKCPLFGVSFKRGSTVVTVHAG